MTGRPRPARARRRAREERGVVAVEAALVTGVVLAMIFGILEMAFLMRDHVGVTSAARVGARAASTGAAAGLCVADPADVPPCPANGVPELAQLAADAISRGGTVLPDDSVLYLMVYKANEHGFPGGATSMPALSGCGTECVAYRWSAAQNRFRYAQGSWDSRQLNGCANSAEPLDAVGVQVVVRHDLLTGIFGQSMELTDHAVMSFEPLPNNACGPGDHQ